MVSLQGYVIYSVRKKLRKKYMHLKGKQIEKIKKSGVEVCCSYKKHIPLIDHIICMFEIKTYCFTSYSFVQITDTILSPEVAFTGDTKSDFFLDPHSSDALRAKILITEVSIVLLSFILVTVWISLSLSLSPNNN